MPINPFIHFHMAHRWSDRLSFFRSSSYAFRFFRTAPALSQISWFSAQKPRLAQKQQHKQQQQQQQAADHCKAFQKPLRAGCWLAAILTRQSERDANEVRTRSKIKFWETDPLSLLTNSLVATRFRILVRTVNLKLKSFQRRSRRANQPSSSYRQEQGDRRGDKGRVRETEGRQRDTSLANKAAVTNLSGHRLFET